MRPSYTYAPVAQDQNATQQNGIWRNHPYGLVQFCDLYQQERVLNLLKIPLSWQRSASHLADIAIFVYHLAWQYPRTFASSTWTASLNNILVYVVSFFYGANENEHDERLRNVLRIARKACDLIPTNVSSRHNKYPSLADYIPHMVYYQIRRRLKTYHRCLSLKTSKTSKGSCAWSISCHHIYSTYLSWQRHLPKKANIWQWEEDHQSMFEKTKQLVSANDCLQYYDPTADVHLEPVAFASNALNHKHANYSNIERECLAVVYGIQRYHHYLYGRLFTLISDHKPLEVILHKPLHCAPLEHCLIKVIGLYNYFINMFI